MTAVVDGIETSAVRWRDNRAIALLSTYAGSEPVRELSRWNSKEKTGESVVIGAGAIELAGACASKISDSGGTGAQQNLWGTCKKLKRLMKKPNIQQRKCSACHPWQRTHFTDVVLRWIHSFLSDRTQQVAYTEANSLRLDHCCSAFHKAPFWGHYCTFCTLPNSNMACGYTSMQPAAVSDTPTL